jgi:hypothetical protein
MNLAQYKNLVSEGKEEGHTQGKVGIASLHNNENQN